MGDLQYWIEVLGAAAGLKVIAFSFGIPADPAHDLLCDSFFSGLRAAAWNGHIDGYSGGPPCSTWSRARWAPGGPPPVRSRALPYGLPRLNAARNRKCLKGSELFLRQLDIADGVASCGGSAVTEHPADPGHAPFSSIFATLQFRQFRAKHPDSLLVQTDQCMRGAATRKRTMLGGCLRGLHTFYCHCDHGSHSTGNSKRRNDGSFKTQGTEMYPSHFCKDLAMLFIRAFTCSSRPERTGCGTAQPWRGVAGLTPAGRPSAHAADDSAVWPLAPCGEFPAVLAAARDAATVRNSSERFQ